MWISENAKEIQKPEKCLKKNTESSFWCILEIILNNIFIENVFNTWMFHLISGGLFPIEVD